jgi:5'-3' exonuclease
VKVHLVDGTYELFRHFFALPSHVTAGGEEVGAVRGVVGSVLGMLGGVSHIGVATDHVIESWRNARWAGYKDGSGVDPALRAQFPLLEEVLAALGVVVWPMVDWEADDALASAARVAAEDGGVEQVVICTPDKDLAQCVVGNRVVQLDRRKKAVTDAAGVRAKFGVDPPSIPDYLALVGDSADGFPGLPGWGAKSAAAVLSVYGHLEDVPLHGHRWSVDVRSAANLAATLDANRDLALLFRELATLRTEPPVLASVGDLRWRGPTAGFAEVCRRIDAPDLAARADRLATRST